MTTHTNQTTEARIARAKIETKKLVKSLTTSGIDRSAAIAKIADTTGLSSEAVKWMIR